MLLAIGKPIGTFNTYVLLTVVYLVVFPFLRLFLAVKRADTLSRRIWLDPAAPGFVPPEGPEAPTGEDLERMF